MCGLVGYIASASNGLTFKQLDAFEEALKLNQLRGDDSTGAVWVNNEDKWKFAKKVGNPARLLNDGTIWPGLRTDMYQNGRLLFGHGRAATRGTVTIENAHPFAVKRKDGSTLLLVHNGTLSYNQVLPGFDQHDVDSQWLATMVAERGAEETFSEVRGAIATMWWDERDNSFNLYRNYERPLSIVTDKDGNVYLNSERAILEYLAFKYKLEFTTEPYELKPFNWARCVPNVAMGFTNTEIARPSVYTYPSTQAAIGGAATQSHFPHSTATSHRRTSNSRGTTGITLTTESSEINPYDEGTDEWMLVEGYCSFIEWKLNDKGDWVKTTFYTGGTFEAVGETPPVAGLIKMYYRQQKRQIIELHTDPKDSKYVLMGYRSVDEAVMELEAEAAAEADEALARACRDDPLERLGATPLPPPPKQRISVASPLNEEVHIEDLRCTFRPGKPARWHTKVPGQNGVIRHQAISDTKYPRFLSWYKNDVDGKYVPDQEITLEYYYSEDLQESNSRKAYCCSMRDKQEVCVDLVFITNQWTKQQLQQIKHFKAKIAWIRVLEKEEREAQTDPTGGIVQCYMKDVVPYVLYEADDGAGQTC